VGFNLASFLERHEVAFHRTVLLLGLCPAAWLAWDCAAGNLGTNPLDRLEKDTGRWAFNYLLIAIAVTPLRRLATWACTRLGAAYGRRLSDWNALIRLRRQLGLTCFFYACLHLGAYAWFDAGLEWLAVRTDTAEKPYILAGLVAFALLVPLAATSTRAAMRALGPHWKRLHRLVYPIAVLATCHFVWLSKPGLWPPFLYTGAVAALLAYHLAARLQLAFGASRDDGMEAPLRPATTGARGSPTIRAEPQGSHGTARHPRRHAGRHATSRASGEPQAQRCRAANAARHRT